MESDPKARLREITARLAALKREREALRAEREQLRAALGREPRQPKSSKSE
jgi:prefoldin subunit 5